MARTQTCATGTNEESISETESWVVDSSLAGSLRAVCFRRHSRKPHRGRRAKSGLHQVDFAQQFALASRQCDVSADSSWNQSTTALLECLEEDFEVDHGRCQGRSSSRSREDTSSMANMCDATENVQSDGGFHSSHLAEHIFTVGVVKFSGVSLGLSLQEYNEGLLIERALPGGVVDFWNSQRKNVQAVANLDQIVSINGITGSQKMLAACSFTGRLVLVIFKGPFQQKEVHVPDDEV